MRLRFYCVNLQRVNFLKKIPCIFFPLSLHKWLKLYYTLCDVQLCRSTICLRPSRWESCSFLTASAPRKRNIMQHSLLKLFSFLNTFSNVNVNVDLLWSFSAFGPDFFFARAREIRPLFGCDVQVLRTTINPGRLLVETCWNLFSDGYLSSTPHFCFGNLLGADQV